MRTHHVVVAALLLAVAGTPAFAKKHKAHARKTTAPAMAAPASSGSTSTQTTPGPQNPKPTQ